MLVTLQRKEHIHILPSSLIGNDEIAFKQSVMNLGLALICEIVK